MPDALFEWQANAMEALLRDIRDRVKAVKPHLVISAYAPASEGFYRFGFPTLSLSPYARNPIYWLQKDLVDLVFDSSYGERVYSVYFEEARSLIDREECFIKVLGNYAKNADGIVVPRDPALLKKLVDYNQRRWPGSTSVYLYSMLNQSQRDMLKSGPFKEPASTTWSSAPIIHGITDDTLIQGQSFDPRENITATDVQDGDLTASITIQGAVDTTVPGTYTLTYTVTDRDHNTTTHIRTITVLAEDPTPPTIPQTPIYRFYSQKHQAHFYTISKEEKDYIQHTYPAETWNYEGIAYNAITQSIENATPIYRFYSQTNQKHFFTISEQEKTDLINNKYPEAKFNYEGIAWYAHEAPQSFTTPLYRFYSQAHAVHFYTVSQAEKEYIQNTYPQDIWNYEGIAWYGMR